MAALAMLLVVLAPLISREMNHPAPTPAAAPVAAHGAHAHTHALHHDHQAMLHEQASVTAIADPPAVDPHAGHDMGVECDYCLIAARMLTFVVMLLLALAPLAAIRHVLSRKLGWHTAAPFSALGARGPPLTA